MGSTMSHSHSLSVIGSCGVGSSFVIMWFGIWHVRLAVLIKNDTIYRLSFSSKLFLNLHGWAKDRWVHDWSERILGFVGSFSFFALWNASIQVGKLSVMEGDIVTPGPREYYIQEDCFNFLSVRKNRSCLLNYLFFLFWLVQTIVENSLHPPFSSLACQENSA